MEGKSLHDRAYLFRPVHQRHARRQEESVVMPSPTISHDQVYYVIIVFFSHCPWHWFCSSSLSIYYDDYDSGSGSHGHLQLFDLRTILSSRHGPYAKPHPRCQPICVITHWNVKQSAILIRYVFISDSLVLQWNIVWFLCAHYLE